MTAVPALPALDRAGASRIVDRAIASYADDCRRRVPDFVDRYFSLRGSLALHRRALGWDLARAPANLLLSVPQLGVRAMAASLGGLGARRAGERLKRLDLLQKTAVARALGEAIERDLLDLLPPSVEGTDGMARALAAEPEVAAVIDLLSEARRRRLDDPAFRAALDGALARYAATRVAAADIATTLTSLGVGAVAFKQVTPSLLSLGPVLAGAIAQASAVSSFPLGATLGGVWHGWFPASAGTALTAGVTGSLFMGAAVLTAFSGVLTDPAQRALGLHQRRLHRLIDGMEQALATGEGLPFNPRDHYIARVVDLIDIARLARRLMAGG
ncbi:hypothetical protein L2U69_14455 [Zavarzinia compransoris]|uniref:DUF6635 family protein n=1 Tax=Zavarzinia marina TaxID=2911065 RepID=UPI001F30A365|nr:DUF6635 family protein [Zavarzinia marina]MCF4166851.1 hypothetical protein [Zavarzinia marina]